MNERVLITTHLDEIESLTGLFAGTVPDGESRVTGYLLMPPNEDRLGQFSLLTWTYCSSICDLHPRRHFLTGEQYKEISRMLEQVETPA